MRRLILSAVFIAAANTAAVASGFGWNGPGWYIVMNTPVKQNSLYRGSYKTEQDCLAAKPENHGAVEYECVQYYRQPMDT